MQAHPHPQRHGSAKLQAARQAAATAREKNRAAQRRYRSRKKVRMPPHCQVVVSVFRLLIDSYAGDDDSTLEMMMWSRVQCR